MLKRRFIPALLLVVTFMFCLTGCSDIGRGLLNELEDNKEGIKSELGELKDGLKAEINEWMGFASKYAITKDKDLKGERKLGVDEYAGSYDLYTV